LPTRRVIRIVWDEARILEIECNSRHRKYKESAHYLKTLIGQPSLDISPTFIPLIIDKVTKTMSST
jgi:hypothetical protein